MPSPRLFAVFLALAPLFFLPGLHDFANLPQSTLVQTGAFMLLLLRWWHPRPSLPFGDAPLDAPLLGLGLWSGASLLWAHTRYAGAEVALSWLACGVVYGLVSRSVVRTEDQEVLLSGVLASGVLVAGLGLGQHFFGLDLVPQAGPPAATFANRNVAAEFIVLALPVAIVRLWRSEHPRGAVAAGLAGALMAGYLFHTRTRSAWLAFALELLALAIAGRRLARGGRGRVRAGIAAAAVGLAVLLMSLTPHGFRSPTAQAGELADEARRGALVSDSSALAPASSKQRSVSIRLAVWRDTVRMVRDRPLAGVGLGNFEVYYPAYARAAMVDPISGAMLQVDQAHNEYLQVAAELGLVGLGLLAWLGVRAARLAVRRVRDAEPEAAAPLLAAATGLVGFGIDACFGFPLHRAIPPLVAAAYLGLLAAGASPAVRERPAIRRWPRIAVVFLALLGVLYWSERRLRADHHVLRMRRADAASDWSGVIAEGAAVRRANPFATLALFRVASAHIRVGAPREALPPLERIVADYPYHISALSNLGIARLEIGQLSGARECFERVLALAPDDAFARYGMGEVLAREGCIARGREELEKAVAAEPQNALYREALRRTATIDTSREGACDLETGRR